MRNKNNIYAVILAGGSGTRFWPKSRMSMPKQFLNIIGAESLFQKTLLRISRQIHGKHIFIMTNELHRKIVLAQAAPFRVLASQILLEPEGKNTAPAICWAASRIYGQDKNAVMAVLPSDHLIVNQPAFRAALKQAVDLAQRDYLVTFGLVPTRPETGYGYLQTKIVPQNRCKICRVERFIEKPDLNRARQFIKAKNYLWNSGMFVWKAGVVLEAFRRYQPRIYKLIAENPTDVAIKKIWNKLPSISIDYGILEKADNVAAVPVKNLGWSDLGSWESLTEVLKKDGDGNILNGQIICSGCKDTAVFGEKRLIATVGLENIVVVDTKDALLICRKDVSQRVKDVVAVVQQKHKSCM